MKRDIRHLKQRGGHNGQSLKPPKNEVTIDETGVHEWFLRHSALRKTKTTNEVTVCSLTNETIDNKVKMYNNAITIKKGATKLKKLHVKKKN